MTEKEENDRKKQFLYEYKNLMGKIRSLQEQLKSIQVEAESARGQELTDMPRGGGKRSGLDDYVIRKQRLTDDLHSKLTRCRYKKLQIESAIAEVKRGIECDVLRKRYLEMKPWEQICIEIGYSWEHTHRIHRNALLHLKLKDDIE